jgi:hypothetical protein
MILAETAKRNFVLDQRFGHREAGSRFGAVPSFILTGNTFLNLEFAPSITQADKVPVSAGAMEVLYA